MNEILLSFLPYTFVTAFTPGPNNILALNTISNHGWKKGGVVVAGIGTGFLCVMVLCALGCFELARFMPEITSVMKYVGAAYIFWLALHVARSKPGGDEEQRNGAFLMGALLQFANVKIILYAVTVYTGYVLPVSQDLGVLMAAALCNTVVGVTGTLTWAAAGGLLQRYIVRYYRPFNLTMALILAWSAVKLLIE